MQTFILNGLNLTITCTEVGKEHTEPTSQLMQRGNLPDVVLVLTSTASALQIHFLPQVLSWVQPISWLSKVGQMRTAGFLPHFFELSHTNPTWAASWWRAQGAAVQGWQRLCTESLSLLTMCSWNVREKAQLPPEVLLYSDISHNCFIFSDISQISSFPNNIHRWRTGYAIWSQTDPWRAATNNSHFAAPNIQLLEWEWWDTSTQSIVEVKMPSENMPIMGNLTPKCGGEQIQGKAELRAL